MSGFYGQSDFISRYLQERRSRAIVTGSVLAIAGIGYGVFASFEDILTTSSGTHLALKLALHFLPGALGIALVVGKLVEMFVPLSRQSAGTALRRYGEPRAVLAAVNSELAAAGVIQIGKRIGSYQISGKADASTYSAEVYLTPSWAVCFSGIYGDRLTVFRLSDVVLAARINTPWLHRLFTPLFTHTWVTLRESHGVRVKLPLPNAGATRLLAEVLARVPWVASHFDPATSRETETDFARFVAAVDRRREELRVTDRKPPTSPS